MLCISITPAHDYIAALKSNRVFTENANVRSPFPFPIRFYCLWLTLVRKSSVYIMQRKYYNEFDL